MTITAEIAAFILDHLTPRSVASELWDLPEFLEGAVGISGTRTPWRSVARRAVAALTGWLREAVPETRRDRPGETSMPPGWYVAFSLMPRYSTRMDWHAK
jgi:hypothetical protein